MSIFYMRNEKIFYKNLIYSSQKDMKVKNNFYINQDINNDLIKKIIKTHHLKQHFHSQTNREQFSQ